MLASPRGHPLSKVRGPARIAELDGQTALLLEDGHCLRDQALSLCSRGHAHEANFRATSLSTLVQMVLGGAGITLLPEMAVGVENRRGELSVRKFVDPAPRRTIVLAWRKQSARGPALREVAAALRDAAA